LLRNVVTSVTTSWNVQRPFSDFRSSVYGHRHRALARSQMDSLPPPMDACICINRKETINKDAVVHLSPCLSCLLSFILNTNEFHVAKVYCWYLKSSTMCIQTTILALAEHGVLWLQPISWFERPERLNPSLIFLHINLALARSTNSLDLNDTSLPRLQG
jgi:hypothetical protein